MRSLVTGRSVATVFSGRTADTMLGNGRRRPRSEASRLLATVCSSGRQRRSEIVFLPKTDRVTTFELSGCLDDHALYGFFPQDIAGSNLLTFAWATTCLDE